MDKKHRINEAFIYLKSRGIVHTQKDIALAMGASASNVSSALKGVDNVLTDSFLSRFNKAFNSTFSEHWLLTGEGEMLSTPSSSTSKADALESSPDFSPQNLVPLVPIAAQGGSLSEFADSAMAYDCEKVISPIKDVDMAICVSGDSMAPEYPPGCQILVKKINERAFIDWGRVYVLDTVNGAVIKKVLPADSPDTVLCVSINPDYPPFEVRMEHINGFYRVMMMMSLK